jgi:hypothetical protein
MTQPAQLSLRKLRHSIRKRAYVAMRLTAGMPGLTKDQQIQVLDQQIILLTEALEKAQQARDIVFLRDFDAHQEAKAQVAQQTSAVTLEFDQLTQGLTWDEEAGKFLDDEEVKSEVAEEAKIEGEQPPF